MSEQQPEQTLITTGPKNGVRSTLVCSCWAGPICFALEHYRDTLTAVEPRPFGGWCALGRWLDTPTGRAQLWMSPVEGRARLQGAHSLNRPGPPPVNPDRLRLAPEPTDRARLNSSPRRPSSVAAGGHHPDRRHFERGRYGPERPRHRPTDAGPGRSSNQRPTDAHETSLSRFSETTSSRALKYHQINAKIINILKVEGNSKTNAELA